MFVNNKLEFSRAFVCVCVCVHLKELRKSIGKSVGMSCRHVKI